MKTKIVEKEQIRYMNSFGETPFEEREITYNIEVNPIKQYGHYEMYSNHGEYHAEGGLWFDDGVLSDYDGIFELPETIKTKLVEWGFIVEGE
tara:strand:- start:899 stop:1174 length:276 start_codon:yes stop_codon:yes gene_type:complete